MECGQGLFPTDNLRDVFNCFSHDIPYVSEYDALIREVRSNGDLGADFGYWTYIANGCVFGGRGIQPGLTELCEALLDHFAHLVENRQVLALRNWYSRLQHSREYLLRLRVPTLRPLTALLPVVKDVASVINSPDRDLAHQKLKRSAAELREQWKNGADRMYGRLVNDLNEGDGILIIGHSRVIRRAVEKANGKKLRLYIYCPGPGFLEGRAPTHCEARCPFLDGGQFLLRTDAIRFIRSGEVDKVLCATCAYDYDAGAVWVTRGGAELAWEAQRKPIPFMPIGGDYKRLTRAPEDFVLEAPSPLTDILRFKDFPQLDQRFLE